MFGLQVMPTSERLAQAMSGLQALAKFGLQVLANFGSEVRPCSKTKSPVERTLSQPKAQLWRSSQSLSSIFSLWIDGYFSSPV